MDKGNFEGLDKKGETVIYGQAVKLDSYDKKIILCLNDDARITLADLAGKIGLSRDAIKNRISRLIKNKVIINFKPLLNSPKMGFPTINYVVLSLYNPSTEQEEKFIEYLKSQKNITYAASLIGKWDYILDIMAEDPGQFNEVLKKIRQKFPNLIKDYEIYGVLNEYKYEEIAGLLR